MEILENSKNTQELIDYGWAQHAQKIVDDGWDLRLRIQELGDELAVSIAHEIIGRKEVELGMRWLKDLVREIYKSDESDSVEVVSRKLAYGAGAHALKISRSERHRLKIKLNTARPDYRVE